MHALVLFYYAQEKLSYGVSCIFENINFFTLTYASKLGSTFQADGRTCIMIDVFASENEDQYSWMWIFDADSNINFRVNS